MRKREETVKPYCPKERALKPNEVIVHVRGEGGSAALYGLRSSAGWLFSLDVIDSAAASLSEAPSDGEEKVVKSWADALELLDKYPWHRLSPVLVHPEFQADIINAVIARYVSPEGDPRPVPAKWSELCATSQADAPSMDLTRYKTQENVHSSDAWLYDLVEIPETPEMREEAKKAFMELGLTEEEAKSLSGG